MAGTGAIFEKNGTKRVSQEEASGHLAELIEHIRETGETIYVEREHQPVIKLAPLEDSVTQETGMPEWLSNLHAIQVEMRAHLGDGPLSPAPEELIREDRDNR